MMTTQAVSTEKQKWDDIVAKIHAMDLTPEEKANVQVVAQGYFASHRTEPNLAGIAAHVKKSVMPTSVQK